MNNVTDNIREETVPTEDTASVLTASEKRSAGRKMKKEARIRKKEEKKLKREYLNRKKIVPVSERPIICPPDKASMGRTGLIIGLVLRALLIFISLFAIVFFACDGFGIIGEGALPSGKPVFLWSAFFTAVLSFMILFPKKYISVPAGIAAIGGAFAYEILSLHSVSSGITGKFADIVFTVWNTAVNHLADVGYLAMAEKAVDGYPVGDAAILSAAVSVAVFVIALIYVPCFIRRVKIASVIIAGSVSAFILWLVHTYNISENNWGTVLIIAGFAALLVLFAFDRTYIAGSKKDETDPDSHMFGEESMPPLPEGYKTRRSARKERRAEKAAAKKKRTRNKEMKSVDEEITDYFSSGKTKRRDKKKDGVPLNPEEKKAAAKAEKERKKAEKKALSERRSFIRKHTDERCAAGGFAGAGMFVLCMIILIIPAFSVKSEYNTVKSLDEKYRQVRKYVTAILMGDDPALDLMSYDNDPYRQTSRDTSLARFSFTGKPMMEIQTNTKYNVYLRGWVATKYDNATGIWYGGEQGTPELEQYRSLFGTNIDADETLKYNFFRLMDPSLIPDDFDYVNNSRNNIGYGFVVSQVNIKRSGLESKLLYMPSYNIRAFNVPGKTSGGKNTVFLRAYGADTASRFTYADYFDGVYTSYRAREDKKGYAMVSMITTMRSSGFMNDVAPMIVNMQNSRPAILDKDGRVRINDTDDYLLKMADGSTVSYRLERRNSEGRSVQNVYESDGYIYVVTSNSVGNAVYRVRENGTVLTKYVENIPDSLKYDSEGYEIRYPAPDLPFAIRYWEFMSDADRSAVLLNYRYLDYYTCHVYQTYGARPSGTAVQELAQKIMAETTYRDYREIEAVDPETGEKYEDYVIEEVPVDFSKAADFNKYMIGQIDNGIIASCRLMSTVTSDEVYKQRHDLVMAFIDYLTDEKNYTYSMTPAPADDPSLIGVEQFLFGSHEGYCVQFATALTLMLRSVGIPARYVEGYVAAGLYNNYDKDRVGSYITTVRDRDSHAWVEVWYDGIGWLQYEATPVYYADAYYVPGGRNDNPVIGPVIDDTDQDPEDDEPELTPEEIAEQIRLLKEQQRRELIRRIILISVYSLIGITVILVVYLVFYLRAKKASRARNALIGRIAGTDPEDPSTVPSGDDVRKMGDLISLLLKECGLSPKPGEFIPEYAQRIAEHNPGALAQNVPEEKLSEIERSRTVMHAPEVERMLNAIAAEEFGNGADPADIPLMARFMRRMYAYEYSRHVNIFRRIALWFFLCRL